MKRIGLVCISVLIFLFFFHHKCLIFLANCSIRAYSVAKWSKPLKFKDLILNGNQLVILQPQLDNETSFSAQQVTLRFHVGWLKRELDVDIAFEKPHWHFITPSPSHWEKWNKALKHEEKWIKIRQNFHINSALATWATDHISEHRQLCFDLEVYSREGGFLKIFFDPHIPQAGNLLLQAVKTDKGMEMNCHCHKVNCSSFFTLCQFFGIGFQNWLVTSGFLEGQMNVIFQESQRPHLQGELFVEKLVFHQVGRPLKGEVEQARIILEKNQTANAKDEVSIFTGRLDVLKPAFLVFDSPTEGWRMDKIEGSIQLNNMETALINFCGESGDIHSPSIWRLNGTTKLTAHHSFNLNLILSSSFKDEASGKICLFLQKNPDDYKHAELQLENLSHRECDFLQTILSSYCPLFKEITIEQGEINAHIEANVTDQGIGELQINEFLASNLNSKFKPWNARCYFKKARGQGKIHLGCENFWHSIYADLHLEDGEIEFEDMAPHFPLTHIQADLLVRQGIFEHSLVTLQLAGLKGILNAEWGEDSHLLTLKLEGIFQDLVELLPQSIQQKFRKKFHQHQLVVLTNIKKLDQQVVLDGTLHIQKENSDQIDAIHFGCDLKKINSYPTKQFVPVGWFCGDHLSLNKYLSPIIFSREILQMDGELNIKGVFDHRSITVNYEVENLSLENDDFLINTKQFHSATTKQLKGTHQLDLNNFSHQGTLPIQDATYLNKHSGLFFQNIQGTVHFENQIIRILPIEAYCQGVFFAGDLKLDYSDPTPAIFDLAIRCPILSGKISQVQKLLAHLDQNSFLLTFPLEGLVLAKEDGIKLNFRFEHKDYTLQADIRGTITDSALSFKDHDVSLKGIYMDVDYQHQEHQIKFSDIQGTLLVGKPRRVEEYLFLGKYLRLNQIEKSQMELDLDFAIVDDQSELARIVGFTKEEEQGTQVYLNQELSHISCIFPHVWQCRLKNSSQIDYLEFCSQFDLRTCLEDLSRFRQSGLFGLSHNLIAKLSSFLPLEGQGSFALHFHPDNGYHFQINGDRVTLGSSEEHFGILKGSKIDKRWIIDQIQWDDLHLFAEVQQTEEKWKIPFLGLHGGQGLLLGLRGEFYPNEGILRAWLNFCEINLAKLDQLTIFHSLATKWAPKGCLKAKGEIECDFFSSNCLDNFKATLCSEIEDFSIRDYPLQVVTPFAIKICANQGCHLQDVKIELLPKNKGNFIDLKEIDYHPNQESLAKLKCFFQIPSSELNHIGQSLFHHFPEIFNQTFRDLFIDFKRKGEIKGSVTVNQERNHSLFRLNLCDGKYQFKKREFDLKKFELEIEDNEVSFSTFSQEECCPFQIIGKATWPTFQQGHVQFISEITSSHPLKMIWEKDPQQGVSIRSIDGEFSGCHFLLDEDIHAKSHGHLMALKGSVTIDINRLIPFLSTEVAKKITNLKIGSTYSLMGNFWIHPDFSSTFLDAFSFKGSLTSKDSILKGYQFKNLQSDLQYVPGRLDMQTLSIQDSAGGLSADSLIIAKDQEKEKWTIFIPSLIVKNLKPCLLKDVESSHTPANVKFRSLIVKKVDLQNFSGELDNVQTWQAQGNLHFLNSSRKNPFHPLLAIPAEIILRLGLDPHVLNPVTGTIFFNLQGDKIYFTRFKDVFSEGRGSKFYLAQGPNPSWMDFVGNLSVQVRMKQYNLIFKIAELFTVSIQGNVKKPRYTLHKQPKAYHKGHALSLLNVRKS